MMNLKPDETQLRARYALVHARLHQTIERMYTAREQAPLNGVIGMPLSAAPLLAAEQRAWIRAHGSADLQQTQDIAAMERSGCIGGRSRRVMYGNPRSGVEVEWLAKTFPEHLKGLGGPERVEQGFFYERRVPGASSADTYMLVGSTGWVEPVKLSRVTHAMGACVQHVEGTWGTHRALAFLGVDDRGKHAQFLLEERRTGRQSIEHIHLDRDVDLTRYAFRSLQHSLHDELKPLAVSARTAAQIRGHREIAAGLEAHYELPVTPVRQPQVNGRVDRLFKMPDGQPSAVVVTDRALHLVKIATARAREVRHLLSQQVTLTRNDKGLSIAVVPQHERAVKRTAPGFELGR